ncbi:MAG: hypothetical protein PHI93_11480 [Kiritimatiellae bacterium]|jgi:hypothetical protein|nr:hypothetical protein [Kiritimatiellia bacterium]MDY0150097.1 hypothetical protein [Kiritimatiellia bacterium]
MNLRQFILVSSLICLVGCASKDTGQEFDHALQARWAKVPESDFPPPATTPYDADDQRRDQYLKGYADGVRELLRQHKEGKLTFGDQLPPTEGERPYSDGETAGSLAVVERAADIIKAVTKEQTDKWK